MNHSRNQTGRAKAAALCSNRAAQTAVAAALALSSSAAMAGFNGGAGIIMHAPHGNPVPAIGGIGLVALALLLSVAAVRLFKRSGTDGSKFLIAAMGVAVLVSGASGLKVMNDAYALTSPKINLKVDSGGTVTIPDTNGCYEVLNTTNLPQSITDIQANLGWVLTACNGGVPSKAGAKPAIMNGGGFQGTCSDSPSTLLEVGEFCEISAIDLSSNL